MRRSTRRLSIAAATTLSLPLAGLVLEQEPRAPTTASAFQDPAGALDPTAKSCGACHQANYEEWNGRAHSQAWVDPIYQAHIATKKRKKNCLACHIPQSALERLGRKPKTRDVHLDEGVTCVSCHEMGGVIHGPFGAATDAHKSVKHAAFSREGSVELCASCHGTSIADVLGVARDHAKVYPDKVKKTCVECHMPEVERPLAVDPATGEASGPVRKGRSHRVLGPWNAEFCATAFAFSARSSADQLTLTVENHAGHRVPGLKIRTFRLHVHALDAGGATLAEHQVDISGRDPLPFDPATRDYVLPAAPGATQVRVVVEHLLQDESKGQILDTKIATQ